MKKLSFLIIIAAFMLTTACSVVDEVNQSLDYVNEANSLLNSMSDFAENVPGLIENAASDPEMRTELENQVNTLTENIEEFNNIDAPAVAEDLHQDLVSKNEELLNQLEQVQQDGEVMVEEIQNSEIFKTVEDITSLIDAVEKLEL